MTALEYLSVVLMLPVAGLLIGGVLLMVARHDAEREDRRRLGTPAE